MHPADPTIFMYEANPQNVMMYRLSAGIKTQDAIAELTSIFNKYNPAYPFTYTFADDSYAAKFKLETLIGKLAGLFAAFAIFISCLGLFGLAAYIGRTTNQRDRYTQSIGCIDTAGMAVTFKRFYPACFNKLFYCIARCFVFFDRLAAEI